MTANANIVTDSRSNVLVVPASAISYARTQLARQAASGTPIPFGGTGARASGTPGARPSGTAGAQGGAQGQRGQGGQGGAQGGQGGLSGQRGQGGFQGQRGQGNQAAEGGVTRAPILVMDQGKVSAQLIQIGLSDGRNTEVVSGLEPGQTVVVGVGVGTTLPSGAGQSGQPGQQGPRPGGGPFGRGID
jgi:HlyD family secretion protein